MSIGQILFINLAALTVMFLVLWGVSLRRRDVSIIDIFWGLGFVLVAWLSLLLTSSPSMRSLLLTVLVSLWGTRLGVYLAGRNWGKSEDFRYAAMRKRHGPRFPIVSLFTVFGLQEALMWIVSWPIQIGIAKALDWNLMASLGVLLWIVGLCFEAIGDYQLSRFKRDPTNHGQVMNRGLWRYTRHPNYFGDFLVWWGFFFIAAEPSSWWWTIVGPLLMSTLLVRVSGVRLLESSLRSRVAGYEDYVYSTSSFFPLPPRRQRTPD